MAKKQVSMELRKLCSSLMSMDADYSASSFLEILKDTKFSKDELNYMIQRFVLGLSSEDLRIVCQSIILLEKIKEIDSYLLENVIVTPKSDDVHARPTPFELSRFAFAQSLLDSIRTSATAPCSSFEGKYADVLGDLICLRNIFQSRNDEAFDACSHLVDEYFSDVSKFSQLALGFEIIACIINDKRFERSQKLKVLGSNLFSALSYVLRMSLSATSLTTLPPANASALFLLKSIIFQAKLDPYFAVELSTKSSPSEDLLSLLPFILENQNPQLALACSTQIYLRTDKDNKRDCQLAMLKRAIQNCVNDPSISIEKLFRQLRSVFQKASMLKDLVEILESFASAPPKFHPAIFNCISAADKVLPLMSPSLRSKLKKLIKKTCLDAAVLDSFSSLICLSAVYGGTEFFFETEERIDQSDASSVACVFDILLSIASLQGRLPTVWANRVVQDCSGVLDEESLEILFSSIHNPNVEEAIDEDTESEFDNFDEDSATSSFVDSKGEDVEVENSETESVASEELEQYEQKLAEMFRIKRQLREGSRIKKESEASFKSKIWDILVIIAPKVGSSSSLAFPFLIHLCKLPTSLVVTNQFSKVVSNLDFAPLKVSEPEWMDTFELIVKRPFPEPAVLLSIWAALRRTLFRITSKSNLLAACDILWGSLSSPACRAKYLEILSSSLDVVFKDFTLSEFLDLVKEPYSQLSSEKKIVRQAFANLLLKIITGKAVEEEMKSQLRPIIIDIAEMIRDSFQANISSSALREDLRPLLNIIRRLDDKALAFEALTPIQALIEDQPRYSNSRAEIRKLMQSA